MAGRGVIESRERAGDDGAGKNIPAQDATRFDFSTVLGIADAIPTMIAYVDAELRYRFVNRALADWFGRPRSEMLGRTVREVLGEDVFAVRAPLFNAAMAGERQWFASEYAHPQRGPLAVQSEYIPQADSSGLVTGLVLLVEDVTEQRIAGRALVESEARFARIANSAPAMMWVTRLDRTRDFVNEAYCDFLGVPPDEARTFDWTKALHPDDVDRIIAESIAGEASRQPFTLEARYCRHDKEYRWLKSVSQPRFGPDDEFIGFIGVATDITVAKEAEIALKAQVEERTAELSASETRLRSIFDTVLEIIVLTKPDGTIVQMNRTKAGWRDEHPEAAIGGKLWDAPTMQAFPHHRALMREAVATAARGENFEREVMLEREGMPNAFLDVSLRPVRGENSAITYLLFEARDITELKAAQEQLRQSQKMEALGQLTGGIAHDFNNLLTVVVGGVDLIAKKVADPTLRRHANNALSAAERGARLTAQLLAFSRVQKLEVRPTHIAPLIENMRPLLRNVLGPGIEKKFDLDRESMPVMADPTQFELAVLNLAINARDAMPDGGLLQFATRKVHVTDDPDIEDGDYVEVAIRDSGKGMSADVAARAFEPFFTTKDVGKGTGLGLSMVYGVARQSGGTARIDSVPNEGTTVRLYFRRADEDHDGKADARHDDGLDHGEAERACVLVVDDDPDVRAFIVSSLEDLGHDLLEAEDGAAGLDCYARKHPDLVILDYLMPGLSGADVARQILAMRPDQPILFVSGYSETEAIERVAPGAPLLAKPFRADALAAAVRDALKAAAGSA